MQKSKGRAVTASAFCSHIKLSRGEVSAETADKKVDDASFKFDRPETVDRNAKFPAALSLYSESLRCA